MAKSVSERVAKYRQRIKRGELKKIEATIPFDDAVLLGYLADEWQCTKAAALSRVLREAWSAAGNPITGYDKDGDPLP